MATENILKVIDYNSNKKVAIRASAIISITPKNLYNAKLVVEKIITEITVENRNPIHTDGNIEGFTALWEYALIANSISMTLDLDKQSSIDKLNDYLIRHNMK